MSTHRDARANTIPLSRRGALGFAAATLLAPSAFAKTDPLWIPYTYDGGIRLGGLLNGQTALIILDSGTSGVVLDRAAAERFGVAVAGRTARASGIGNSVELGVSGPYKLTLPGQNYNVRSSALGDFSAMAQAAEPFDLMLGRPAFENFLIDIDFDHQRLAFRRSLPGEIQEAPYLALRPTSDNLRSVDVSVGDGQPFQAVFDLGSTATLTVSKAYADEHQVLNGLRRSRWIAAGIDGFREFDVATLPRIRVGPMELTNMPLDVNPEWLSDSPGNLGYGVLSQFGRIITDYRQNRLYVVAREGPQRPFPKNRSGIAVIKEGERCRVILVAPSSPAERGGWRKGDEFVAINGVAVAQSYNRLWGHGVPGSVVAIVMADGSARTLTLEDYY